MDYCKEGTALFAARKLADSMRSGSYRQSLVDMAIDSKDRHYAMRALHILLDTPAPEQPRRLSVSERHQRLHYILSEFIETVEASGFQLYAPNGSMDYDDAKPLTKTSLKMEHIEGSQQDIPEMLDGLADLVIVCYGMAVEMGYDLNPIIREAIAGSVTKLQPDGRIKKNVCQKGDCDWGCDNPNHRPVPDEPVGKWIKGPNYTPPNIAAIIELPKEN